jgi:hypothetical protein
LKAVNGKGYGGIRLRAAEAGFGVVRASRLMGQKVPAEFADGENCRCGRVKMKLRETNP